MRICAAALLVALVALTGCTKRQATPPGPKTPSATAKSLRSTRPAGSFDVTSELPQVNHTLDTEFVSVRLVGMNVPSTVRRGQPFDIGFSWLCVSKPRADWTIAVHIDHEGKPSKRVTLDHQPPLPTTKWEVGKYVSWSRPFVFTADMPAGTYAISTYPYETGGKTGGATKVPQTGGSMEPTVKMTVQ